MNYNLLNNKNYNKLFFSFLLIFISLFSFFFASFNVNFANADTELSHDGFYVEKGVSIRIVSEGNSGLRYTIALTKEQYNAYILDYDKNISESEKSAKDMTWTFFVQLGFNRLNGESVDKGLPILRRCSSDIHTHFATSDKPYYFYVSLFFNDDKNFSEVEKTEYEIYQMLAETEVYVNYIGLDINGDVKNYPHDNYLSSKSAWNATKNNIEYSKSVSKNDFRFEITNRSVRSIVLSLFVKGSYSFDKVKRFLITKNCEYMLEENIDIDSTELFYDKDLDFISFYVGEDELLNVQKVYFNSTPVDFSIVGGELIINGIDSLFGLEVGQKCCINLDTMNSVYSFNNVVVE